MIKNRDKDATLAAEVLKKKKALGQKRNEEKKKMIIAYISIGAIALVLIVVSIFDFSGSQEAKITEFETPEITDIDKYNSKLEALEAIEKKRSNASLMDIFSQQEQDTLADASLEEEQLRKDLAAFDERLEATPKPVRASRSPQKDVYGDYSMWEDGTPDKTSQRKSSPTLTYAEKLRQAKQARYGADSDSPATEEKVETRVAIFRDQFLIPGQLAELVLTKSFTYQGKTYKRGTPVYAYINISKTRVLFDIQNIAHQPLNIEVRDIRDGLIGMYSSRAGELWKKYEAEGINNTTDAVATGITRDAIVSNSVDAVSRFFQKKRVNKNEKIMLLNDQELIVHILDKRQ